MKYQQSLQDLSADTDSFLLYTDVDNYLTAFAYNVSRQDLLNGYACDVVPVAFAAYSLLLATSYSMPAARGSFNSVVMSLNITPCFG